MLTTKNTEDGKKRGDDKPKARKKAEPKPCKGHVFKVDPGHAGPAVKYGRDGAVTVAPATCENCGRTTIEAVNEALEGAEFRR